jgi:hypothetical protein
MIDSSHADWQVKLQPPEIALVLCCARTKLDPSREAQVRELVERGIDWVYLTRIGQVHGVLPLLYKNITAACSHAVPAEIHGQIRAVLDAHVKHNLLLTAELIRIVRLFRENGITVLPYKGPILAASVYGDVSLRSFSDLDILVAKRDVRSAKHLMLSQGYRPYALLTTGQEAARLRSRNAKDFAFVRADERVRVELHWEITGIAFFPLDTNRLWGRLEQFTLGGVTLLNLQPEDLLLVLCVHGARHFFRRLEWICDIAELLSANPGLRWNDVLQQAMTLGAMRMLFFGLLLASDLLGCDLPDEIRSVAQSDRDARLLSERAKTLLFSEANETSEIVRRQAHRIALRERGSDRMRLRFYYLADYLRALVTPNEADRKRVHLPVVLSFLYVLLRPIRLVRVYGMDLLASHRKQNHKDQDVARTITSSLRSGIGE